MPIRFFRKRGVKLDPSGIQFPFRHENSKGFVKGAVHTKRGIEVTHAIPSGEVETEETFHAKHPGITAFFGTPMITIKPTGVWSQREGYVPGEVIEVYRWMLPGYTGVPQYEKDRTAVIRFIKERK